MQMTQKFLSRHTQNDLDSVPCPSFSLQTQASPPSTIWITEDTLSPQLPSHSAHQRARQCCHQHRSQTHPHLPTFSTTMAQPSTISQVAASLISQSLSYPLPVHTAHTISPWPCLVRCHLAPARLSSVLSPCVLEPNHTGLLPFLDHALPIKEDYKFFAYPSATPMEKWNLIPLSLMWDNLPRFLLRTLTRATPGIPRIFFPLSYLVLHPYFSVYLLFREGRPFQTTLAKSKTFQGEICVNLLFPS